MLKRKRSDDGMLEPPKRAKISAEAKLEADVSVSLDILPLEILGQVFKYFCFDIWLRVFIKVSKRWKRACQQADANKQISLNLAKPLLFTAKMAEEYRVTTMIFYNTSRYCNFEEIKELLFASDRLHTLVFCFDHGQHAKNIGKQLLRGISTLSIAVEDCPMLDGFPDLTRLEIRSTAADILKQISTLRTTQFSKVKELSIVYHKEDCLQDLKTVFPNLQHVALYFRLYDDYLKNIDSIAQRWPISYSVVCRNAPLGKHMSYEQFFRFNSQSLFFKLVLNGEYENALEVYYKHSSFEYECDLNSRAQQYHFPSSPNFRATNFADYSTFAAHPRSNIQFLYTYKYMPAMNETIIRILPALDWPMWIRLSIYVDYGTIDQIKALIKAYHEDKRYLLQGGPNFFCGFVNKISVTEIVHFLGPEQVRDFMKVRDEDGATFLHAMIRYKNEVSPSHVNELSQYIDDWSPRDIDGNTPLFRAFKQQKRSHADFLLSKGATLGSNNVQFEDLASTCNYDLTDTKQYIKCMNVDWHNVSYYVFSELKRWGEIVEDAHGHWIMTRMYNHNASLAMGLIRHCKEKINYKDSTGRTLLVAALEKDASPRTFLTYGADPNLIGPQLLASPLMLAVNTATRNETMAIENITLLLEHGAHINTVVQGPRATQTALSLAVSLHLKNIVELLLSRGADVTFVDNKGNNLMHLLCKNSGENGSSLVSLLALYVDINRKNNHGHTPLQCAKNNNVLWLEQLVKYGAK